ncbi:glutamyl-tRNA reductase [Nocardioides sp. GY 10127]|uniref:glutamyl-tRNA reductase n=1 Tax=Nocardioides sp. GY 10127 TaxID=2569762 RepID=UPI0010A9111E|nr:glutamyl-tRNA reductase [Nocardioides sp. GY 10127]TIC80118.1 glutamyl-tRNA reductase [Nocardioides sp. GY 10127]
MSVLVVGISHNTAPVSLLERVAASDPGAVSALVKQAADCAHVTEAAIISTCNRLELYADVDRFHGSVEELSSLLVERAGERTETMLPHLYVHYDDGAVSHLFQVAAGLDSMAVGEGQILGQTREALRVGQELGTVGPALNSLFQQALRVGKRSRAETDIDRAAPTLVGAALAQAGAALPLAGTAADDTDGADGAGPLAGISVAVLGAGAMAGLATATVHREGVRDLVVLNRTPARAERLAEAYGGRPAPVADLEAELGRVDLLLTCTGSTGAVVTAEMLRRARPDGRPLTIIDLALPHDVEPHAGSVEGITLVNLASLASEVHGSDAAAEIHAVREIVTQEVAAFLTARRQASVTPTVVALRTMATGVVESEMTRLEGRLPELDERTRGEVLHTVRRVVDKLLHEPTVRVRELANSGGAVSYAAALAELFSLDPEAVTAVTRPDMPSPGTTPAGGDA